MTTMPAVGDGTQALRKAVALLGLVADAAPATRFVDLLDRSGLPKGTLHRTLSALVETGMLRLDERSGQYRLGVRLFELAHRVWDEFDLRGAAEPELERLAARTGEAVRLSVLDGADALTVDQRGGTQAVRLGGGVGGRTALHASGAGKAILAQLPAPDRQRLLGGVLSALTPSTLVDPAALDHDLTLTVGRGYALSVEEQTPGVSSVAAAVLDHQARPVGALSVVGPAFRLPLQRLHALGRDVIEAARRVSDNAGQVAMTLSTVHRPPRPDRGEASVAFPGTAFLAEGPCWCADGLLRWVDMLAPAVLTGDPATGQVRATPMPVLTSAIVPRARGGFVLATPAGYAAWNEGRTPEPMQKLEPGLPRNRLNDAKCDGHGRLWGGTMALDTTPAKGALWRLDPGGQAHRMDTGFTVSNGLGWSPDGRTMYFADSGPRRIYAYPCDPGTGALGERRAFVQVPDGEGVPDGLAVDAAGFVWVAHWDAWCVTRYDPDGRIDRVVPLPVPRPTSCAFGGPDLRTLFITTARIRLSAQQLAEAALSGSVLALPVDVPGLPVGAFAG